MNIEGLLLLDKPKGWTSHDVVAVIRRRLPKGFKVGHAGTLDPLATGLLVLLVGRATRQAALLQGLPKTYGGRIRLGVETDTGDMEGTVTREVQVPVLTDASLQQAMDAFLGESSVLPPLYSAVKFKGRPLYSYARQGLPVELKPRPQRVDEWRLLGWHSPELEFLLRCSGGTYVRTLAVKLGQALGSAGVVSELRRHSVGPFEASGAVSVDLAREMPLDRLAARLLPASLPASATPAAKAAA